MSASDESHWKQDIEPRTDYNSEEEDSNDAESFGYEQKSGNYPLFFLTNNFPAGVRLLIECKDEALQYTLILDDSITTKCVMAVV